MRNISDQKSRAVEKMGTLIMADMFRDYTGLIDWIERAKPFLENYVRCVNDASIIADGFTQEHIAGLLKELGD